MGYVYQRKLKGGTISAVWSCKYYDAGRPVRESTGCTKEQDARAFLKRREGAVANGAPIIPRVERIQYEEIARDLRQHYATVGTRDLVEVEKRLKHVDRFFSGRRIIRIGGAEAAQYVVVRQQEGGDQRDHQSRALDSHEDAAPGL